MELGKSRILVLNKVRVLGAGRTHLPNFSGSIPGQSAQLH